VWKGTWTQIQKGRCAISGSGQTIRDAELLVEVASDGSFKAVLKDSKTFSWTGNIDKNLNVAATLSGNATCGSQARVFTASYSGKITEKKGKYRLQLEGVDEVCPAQSCRFKSIYYLKQK
jgi:hypothetical protein